MSYSPDLEAPNHDNSKRSSSFALDPLTSKNARNHDVSEYRNSGQDSPSLSFEMQPGHTTEAQEEGLLTGRPTSYRSSRDRPKTLGYAIFHNLIRWIEGSAAPRPFRINPILPQLQKLPTAAFHKGFPEQLSRLGFFAAFHLFWFISCFFVLYFSLECGAFGDEAPVRLSCVSRFWRSSTLCGVDASNCHTADDMTLAFRCPAGCGDTIISSPEIIGDKEYNYRTIVVGGPSAALNSNLSIYRGDSFICAAAIHAGLFTNLRGGGGAVSLTGEHGDFPAVDSNGISSLNFTPSFPVSFTFKQDTSEYTPSCADPWWFLLVATFLLTIVVSIFTTSRRFFFGSTFFCVYFCVALATDPPDFKDYMSVVSWAFRGFLPSAFVGLAIYHFCVRRSLAGLNAPMEKTILWLGGCWLGALSNFTFEKLPIQRLTLHDLQQPGAIFTVITITLVVLFIAVSQAWAFRVEGRLLQYLAFYACLGVLLLVLAVVPYIDLRIHHYILALILLPGTALQTRPSLFYQGLLVGLFINGIARWGFDSIVQTPRELYGDDFNTITPPIPTPILNSNTNITFSWSSIKAAYDGISILVNDVERFRRSDNRGNETFTWTRYKETEPEYFRFAYVKNDPFDASSTGKFTKPGTWGVDGSWMPPPEPESGE